VLSEPEDEEDSDAVVKRSQLITSALQEGLQMMYDISHVFEVDHFMDTGLKFEHEMEAVMAQLKEDYKDMQK
jgi:hypothetical protein